MKKIFSCLFLLVTTMGFAKNLVVDNKTPYPIQEQKSKIAVQWAATAKEVDEYNKAIISGDQMNPNSFQMLTQTGMVHLKVPNNAEHFRVLVWTQDGLEPNLLTNWVDIVPNKTYTIKTDHLVPAVLMPGSGC